jgi:hypothetical protein
MLIEEEFVVVFPHHNGWLGFDRLDMGSDSESEKVRLLDVVLFGF